MAICPCGFCKLEHECDEIGVVMRQLFFSYATPFPGVSCERFDPRWFRGIDGVLP